MHVNGMGSNVLNLDKDCQDRGSGRYIFYGLCPRCFTKAWIFIRTKPNDLYLPSAWCKHCKEYLAISIDEKDKRILSIHKRILEKTHPLGLKRIHYLRGIRQGEQRRWLHSCPCCSKMTLMIIANSPMATCSNPECRFFRKGFFEKGYFVYNSLKRSKMCSKIKMPKFKKSKEEPDVKPKFDFRILPTQPLKSDKR